MQQLGTQRSKLNSAKTRYVNGKQEEPEEREEREEWEEWEDWEDWEDWEETDNWIPIGFQLDSS